MSNHFAQSGAPATTRPAAAGETRLVTMEDHFDAYYAWRDAGVQGRALLHVDAHPRHVVDSSAGNAAYRRQLHLSGHHQRIGQQHLLDGAGRHLEDRRRFVAPFVVTSAGSFATTPAARSLDLATAWRRPRCTGSAHHLSI